MSVHAGRPVGEPPARAAQLTDPVRVAGLVRVALRPAAEPVGERAPEAGIAEALFLPVELLEPIHHLRVDGVDDDVVGDLQIPGNGPEARDVAALFTGPADHETAILVVGGLIGEIRGARHELDGEIGPENRMRGGRDLGIGPRTSFWKAALPPGGHHADHIGVEREVADVLLVPRLGEPRRHPTGCHHTGDLSRLLERFLRVFHGPGNAASGVASHALLDEQGADVGVEVLGRARARGHDGEGGCERDHDESRWGRGRGERAHLEHLSESVRHVIGWVGQR